RPKMVFSASVIAVGDVGIADTQTIVRPEYDVFYSVRIHKLVVNLHDPDDADVELGDHAHFKESKAERASRPADKAWKKRHENEIQEMKRDWDDDLEGMKEQIKQGYEQALIDANANIEAAEVRMQEELDTQRTAMLQNIEAAEQAAKDAAAQNLADTTERINTTIDTNRAELSSDIQNAKQEAIEQAESDAKEKADVVQSNLDSFKDTHQQMYDEVTADVMDIDEFLGNARDIPLDQRFLNMTAEFEERLENSTRSASNLIRGSRFDEPDMYNANFIGTSIYTSEDVNFVRFDTTIGVLPVIRMEGELHLHEGVEYHLHLEYRSNVVTELDGFIFYHNDGRTERLENRGLFIGNLTTSGAWEHASMTLKPNAEMSGRLALGTRQSHGTSPEGIIDVRLPYLTTTAHDQWLPHPLDANQNIEEISSRITQLEDGYSEFIVRSEGYAEMNALTQTVRDYQTTVDGVEDIIIQLENSELISRGREVLDTVDGFQRKVWMGDIDRQNLIPHAVFDGDGNRDEWGAWGRNGTTYGGRFKDYAIVGNRNSSSNIGIVSPEIGEYVIPGQQYTLSWEASTHYPSTTDIAFNY